MKLYKVLGQDGRPCHGGKSSFKWPLPTQDEDGTWTPGEWKCVTGKLKPCRHGLHLCRERDLVQWLGPRIFEAEYEGEIIEEPDKIVVRKASLLSEVTTWNERTARLFACDCAERVLPFFEKEYPDDKRPRQCIETARRFANGEATKDELYAARDAAKDVAWYAASHAAWDVAWYVARDVARDVAWYVAWDAEQKWQTDRLMMYLNGEIP